MKTFLKVKDVAEQLRVSPVTVRSYTNSGKLKFDRNPSGQRVFQQAYVDEFLGKKAQKTFAFYVRSSNGDDTLMNNQVDALTELYGTPLKIYRDKSSGLNENRKGLRALMEDAQKGRFTTVVITQRDRLARFGFSYLESYFAAFDIDVIIAFDETNKSLQDELMQDFMSLVASFSGKFYRLRGWEQQKKLLSRANEVINEAA